MQNSVFLLHFPHHLHYAAAEAVNAGDAHRAPPHIVVSANGTPETVSEELSFQN